MSRSRASTVDGLEAAEALTAFCEAHRLARLSDRRRLWRRDRATSRSRRRSRLSRHRRWRCRPAPSSRRPPMAKRRWSRRSARRSAARRATADLFAGLGTFALALDGQVTAAEAARDAVLALKARARRAIAAEHRDLYRRPLDAGRAGRVRRGRARSAARRARSSRSRSSPPQPCRGSPMSAATPRPSPATPRCSSPAATGSTGCSPVGQFRWSTHVELAAAFSR